MILSEIFLFFHKKFNAFADGTVAECDPCRVWRVRCDNDVARLHRDLVSRTAYSLNTDVNVIYRKGYMTERAFGKYVGSV